MVNNTSSFDSADIETNKIVAALSNFPLLFWLPFVAAPNSQFAKYNANHGLIFLIASVLTGFISRIWFIGGILSSVLGAICSILMIVCIVLAVTSKAYEIPVLDTVKLIK